MMATKERICIFGYDPRKDEPFVILNCKMPLKNSFIDNKGMPIEEKVLLVTPITDTIHNFIFIVTKKVLPEDENSEEIKVEKVEQIAENDSTILRILRINPKNSDPLSIREQLTGRFPSSTSELLSNRLSNSPTTVVNKIKASSKDFLEAKIIDNVISGNFN